MRVFVCVCRFQVRGVSAVAGGRCVRVGGGVGTQGRVVVPRRPPAPHPPPRHLRRHRIYISLSLSLSIIRVLSITR